MGREKWQRGWTQDTGWGRADRFAERGFQRKRWDKHSLGLWPEPLRAIVEKEGEPASMGARLQSAWNAPGTGRYRCRDWSLDAALGTLRRSVATTSPADKKPSSSQRPGFLTPSAVGLRVQQRSRRSVICSFDPSSCTSITSLSVRSKQEDTPAPNLLLRCSSLSCSYMRTYQYSLLKWSKCISVIKIGVWLRPNPSANRNGPGCRFSRSGTFDGWLRPTWFPFREGRGSFGPSDLWNYLEEFDPWVWATSLTWTHLCFPPQPCLFYEEKIAGYFKYSTEALSPILSLSLLLL